jgi:hypothetical protein
MHKVQSYDPDIRVFKTQVMFYILDLVTKGYRHWMRGEVHVDKAEAFATKMAKRYGVHLSESARYNRKQKGQCNSYLVMYPKPESKLFYWWILTTKGEGAIKAEESLKDALSPKSKHRLIWSDEYRLIKLTKPKYNTTSDKAKAMYKSRSTKATGLTWQLQPCLRLAWEGKIQAACQHQNASRMRQIIYSLVRMPAFRGVRTDYYELMTLYKKLLRGNTNQQAWGGSPPEAPKQGWVRRQKRDSIALSQVLSRLKKGKSAFEVVMESGLALGTCAKTAQVPG